MEWKNIFGIRKKESAAREHDYNVDVLVFDGFMVRKTKELPTEIFDELKQFVKEKTTYEIDFIVVSFLRLKCRSIIL